MKILWSALLHRATIKRLTDGQTLALLYGCWTTRGYANSRIVNSRTGRLVDWTSRGVVNSWTRQLAYWTSRGCHLRLCVLSFRFFWPFARPRVVQSVTCPVHELTSPRDVQSVSWQSASWQIRELANPRVGESARCPVNCFTTDLQVSVTFRQSNHIIRPHRQHCTHVLDAAYCYTLYCYR